MKLFSLFKKRKRSILSTYQHSKNWIIRNTIPGKGIIVAVRKDGLYSGIPYPEVSGYFIPSLLHWGFKDIAFQYAKYLVSVQHDSGAWYDYSDTAPYVFDTGQVLKGLIAIYPFMPELKNPIIKGCDWLIDHIDDTGRLLPTSKAIAAIETVSDLIHLYCLSPIVEAANIFDRPDYRAATDKALNYYKKNYLGVIEDFHTLSHFYAYIVEAMVDLGEKEIAKRAMDKVAKLQKNDGSIPAYKDVKWVCSTGIFQFAVIWYKLGEKERADKAFDYACSLQEKDGGWLGSYGPGCNYSQNEEISWAHKYFLDALALKVSSHFATTASTNIVTGEGVYRLVDNIVDNDGRLQLVLKMIMDKNPSKILEVGCGFGRILKEIKKQFPSKEIYGVDVDDSIITKLPSNIHSKVGSLLDIPYPDEKFDFVMAVEVMEHAIDIEHAVRELIRVTKPGGYVLIIDKNIKCWGMFATPPWEQWFDKSTMSDLLENEGLPNEIIENIPYDDRDGKDGLFIGWLGAKREIDFI